MQPAGAIPLYKYTGIFPSSKLGKPATAAPMAPDCTDLVVNFIWKGIFCLHYSRVSQSINRYGDESSSWIHQQGSGTKPKTIFMLFVQEPEVLTVPARYPPSNHLLSPGTSSCHVLRLWGTCHHWLVPPGSSCSPLWLQQSQPEFFPTLLIPVIQSRRPDCLPLYYILAKSPLWNVQYMMKKYSSYLQLRIYHTTTT